MKTVTVTVPLVVLQDLIHNVELACAGMGRGENVALEQCNTLQAIIDDDKPTSNVTDGNVTYAKFGSAS